MQAYSRDFEMEFLIKKFAILMNSKFSKRISKKNHKR